MTASSPSTESTSRNISAHAESVVEYLGRYVFRAAISNARIEAMDDTHVTFRFKSRRKGQGWSPLRLRGEEFLRRFVMHVLPRGFQKVRYYGLWHHSKSDARKRIGQMLRLGKGERDTQDGLSRALNSTQESTDSDQPEESNCESLHRPPPVTCPICLSNVDT